MPDTQPREISRRSVAKGAAWAAPAVTIAAAAPALAASPTPLPPTCPTCLTPGNAGVYTLQAVVAGNTGSLVGTMTANVDARGCDLSLFEPAYVMLGVGATLTMSDGRTYESTLALSAGGGTLGRISAVAAPLNFNNVRFPAGSYGTLTGSPVRPTKLCIRVTAVLVGLPSLIKISCPTTLCYKVQFGTATGLVGRLTGAGTVNYTGALDSAA